MANRFWGLLAAGLVFGALFSAARAADAPAPRVFEIRTYYTFPGRLEALNKRFRDHTRRLFEKHGMTNIGYWVPQDAPARDNTMIYGSPTPAVIRPRQLGPHRRSEWKKVTRRRSGRQDRRAHRVRIHGRE